MSRMSELSQVLDEMIAYGEGMIKAANALKDIFSSTEEAPTKAETKSTKKAAKAPEPTKTEEAQAVGIPSATRIALPFPSIRRGFILCLLHKVLFSIG